MNEDEVHEALAHLIDLGFVEWAEDPEGQRLYWATEDGLNYIEEHGTLPYD